MGLVVHADAATFLARAGAFLAAREAEHGIVLGVAAEAARDPAAWPGGLYATWEEGDEVRGVSMRTPPWPVQVGALPPPATAALAHALDARFGAGDVRGVVGPEATARRLGEGLWPEGGAPRVAMRMRIHMLEAVAPVPAPGGEVVVAGPEHEDVVMAWVRAFHGEAGTLGPEEVMVARTRARLAAGSIRVLWVDAKAVSMAFCGGETPHGARISGVYTPPAHRRRGYATTVVASLSAELLASGRRFCFLYTDLANPTSNAIYARIGYRPVTDVVHLEAPGP